MKAKIFAVSAALAFLGPVAQASAKIVHVVFSGTIFEAESDRGMQNMAPFGANAVGSTYSASYVLDTTLGQNNYGPTSNTLWGGLAHGDTSPVVSASVTINGATFALAGPFDSIALAYTDGTTQTQAYNATEYMTNGSTTTYFDVINSIQSTGNLPISIGSPFSYTVQLADYSDANIHYQVNSATGVELIHYAAQASLTSMTVTTAVPESSTWAMLMLGFAGLGLVGHRSARKAAATA